MTHGEDSTMERRRSTRLKANFPIEFRVGSETRLGGGVAQDVASDGVSFTTPRFLPTGAEVLLTLQINLAVEPITTPARVVWTQRLGYGDLYRVGMAFGTRLIHDVHQLIG
jgi:hypothetical protein